MYEKKFIHTLNNILALVMKNSVITLQVYELPNDTIFFSFLSVAFIVYMWCGDCVALWRYEKGELN